VRDNRVVATSQVAPARPARLSIGRLLERLAEVGARPDESHDEALRHGTMIFASVLITALCFLWVGTYLAYSYPLAAAVPATYQVLTLVGLALLARTRRFEVFRNAQLTAFLVLPALLQVTLGGFSASSGVILWGSVTPLAALACLDVRRSVPWALAFFAVVAVLEPSALPTGLVIFFFVVNIFGVTLTMQVMLGYFVEQRERAHHALERERERSERLLLNVLPAPIAERLKGDGGVIAEHHDSVTVLFADLAGFTEQSTRMDPQELVSLLDRIFTAFDRLADAEGLEKIKTIGDSYMLAGGLPQPHPEHLAAVARVALAMRAEIEVIRRQTHQEWLAVRIGIDTGPVVAGVIGRRKFIYDLWGDTVNTASRMESHGLPGEIQVTQRVAAALGSAFTLRRRGTIEVKGKGPMLTYLLDDTASR
jgi:guanylate cyclase